MPEVITRCVGLAFSAEELKDSYSELEFLDEDSQEFFETAADLLSESHQSGEFEQYGFYSDCELNEISGEGDTIFMDFY